MGEMTLEQARDLLGLGQYDLDDLAGLKRGTVHDLEAGRNKRPSHATVTKVVRALRQAGLVGVTSEQLFPVPTESSPTQATA